MSSAEQIILIAQLILELLEYAEELRELLKRIEAGEEVTDDELREGIESVRAKVKAAHELKTKEEDVS
jgi:hypothetical protein